jgi:hypothetical protein
MPRIKGIHHLGEDILKAAEQELVALRAGATTNQMTGEHHNTIQN